MSAPRTTPPKVVYFDGACEPTNPGGWMASAWVSLDAGGVEIAHDYIVIPPEPHHTNNMAEYLALILALESLKARGHTGTLIRGDSQLVIRQMEGAWRVNSPTLRPLYEHAHALTLVTAPQFQWVRRDLNVRADAYGRAALRAAKQAHQ